MNKLITSGIVVAGVVVDEARSIRIDGNGVVIFDLFSNDVLIAFNACASLLDVPFTLTQVEIDSLIAERDAEIDTLAISANGV